MEFHMINIMYGVLPMRARTEKTTFSCKDNCILTKHTWRWTYSHCASNTTFVHHQYQVRHSFFGYKTRIFLLPHNQALDFSYLVPMPHLTVHLFCTVLQVALFYHSSYAVVSNTIICLKYVISKYIIYNISMLLVTKISVLQVCYQQQNYLCCQ